LRKNLKDVYVLTIVLEKKLRSEAQKR